MRHKFEGRSAFISNLRIFAAFMVVFVHSDNILSYASYSGENSFLMELMVQITRTGVPLFFIISGYLQFRKDFSWKENVLKKCKSLLIPFFIWNTFWCLFDCIGEAIAPSFFHVNLRQGIRAWLVDYFGIPFWETTAFYGPLWFVRDLFILCLFAPIIKIIVKKVPAMLLTIVLVLLWLSPFPYSFREAVCFYFFGAMIAQKNLRFPKPKISVCIAASTVVLSVIAIVLPSHAFIKVLQKILIFGSVYTVAVVFSTYQNSRAVAWFGRMASFSFPIYIWHGKILSTMQVISAKLLPQTKLTISIEYFLLPVLTIVLCIVFARIIKKLLPKPYAFSMGNR